MDVEVDKTAVGSLTEGRKEFNEAVDEIKQSDERGWCELTKITLSKRLTQKQLILAIMSGRSFASKQETLDKWSNN